MSPEPGARRLASIGVAVELESGNVPLLLHELRHALEKLFTDGTPHALDLRTIPLAPGEEERLLQALGEGELTAEFESNGRSELRETAYPGIWRVTHRDAAGTVIGRLIEVTFVPSLLASQRPDVVLGLERLTHALIASGRAEPSSARGTA